MTTQTTPTPESVKALADLADRVEAAAGPDRALDRDIADALGFGPDESWERRRSIPGIVKDMAEGAWIKGGRIRESQRYTASLDAAMSLVPEGAGYNLDRYWIREGVRWKVEIATGGIPEQPRKVLDCWDAYTAPLATVAAALRARAHIGASHD